MPAPCYADIRNHIGLSAIAVAEHGLLIADVFNACANSPKSLTPPALDGSLLAKLVGSGQILGYLVANDVIMPFGGKLHLLAARVCYGVLIKDFHGLFVVVIRGTGDLVEWLVNAELELVGHPTPGAGNVEQGFWSIYDSMQYVSADGSAIAGANSIADALKSVVGENEWLVTGHSLGAAISTYLTFDLAKPVSLGSGVRGCFFASPRPGDADFAAAFQNLGSRYVVIDNRADTVPQLPPTSLGYATLQNELSLSVANCDITMTVRNDILCNHHVVCYAAMLSASAPSMYSSDADLPASSPATWATLLQANRDLPNCLATSQQLAAQNLAGLEGG